MRYPAAEKLEIIRLIEQSPLPVRHVRRQSFWDSGPGKIREVLAHRSVMSGGLQSVLQVTIGNGLSLDPFSFCQDGRASPEVDVGRGKIVDALVVTAVVVVGDEGRDLSFEIAGQEVVFQQDAVLERLVPALDLALGHRVIWRPADMVHVVGVQPLGQVVGHV